MDEIRKIKDMVHGIVDKTVTTVEEIHQSIAQASLNHLEEIAPDQAKSLVEPVRNIHKATAGGVYDIIRTINRKAGEVADEIMDKTREVARKAAEGQDSTPPGH